MQLLVITPDNAYKDETAIVNNLFACGLERLHLRKPSFSAEEYKEYLSSVPSEYHNRIVIHGHFELYHQYRLGGIHLNSMARDDRAARENIRQIPQAEISTSFHSWSEIEENEFKYSYIFISPVFDSISKAGYKAAIDLSEAQQVKEKLAKEGKYCPEIFGLGGIDTEHIQILYKNHFDGAALLGAVWMASDPVKKFKEIRQAVKALPSG